MKPVKERLPMISFRVDEEAHKALLELEDMIEESIPRGRRRSIAIRRAILETCDRWRKRGTEET